jgi:hypothetical protein
MKKSEQRAPVTLTESASRAVAIFAWQMSTTVVPCGEPADDDDDKARNMDVVVGKVITLAAMMLPVVVVALLLVAFDKIGQRTDKARAAAENIMNKSKKE